MARIPNISAKPPQIKPAQIRRFHDALHAWYAKHGRHDLPWRNTDDPYRIWLSEVMLQQTQVATVLARFYDPFLKKFPTVKSLADAPREAVMKAWEGLGYYRRAGNLHEAAKKIVNGEWWVVNSEGRISAPLLTTHHSLLTNLLILPGIGKNTAHAVAAFAYHHPVPILEANVKRVVARIFALETPGDNELWQGAETLLNQDEPFHYNQAMMDLGSLICTPKNPDCPHCPANTICLGQKAPERYPQKKAKKQTPTREVIIHVREDASGRLFLERRDATLLGGLYGFPQHEVSGSGFQVPANSFSPETRNLKPGTFLGTVTHAYTHFKLIGHVMLERSDKRMNSNNWHSRAEIAALPLSTLDHKVLALVENCHSAQKKAAKVAAQRKAR